MSQPGKIRALLATARIANVPSVVSNVWVGIAISNLYFRGHVHQHAILLLTLSGICLYLSGNFFNDWHDRNWDARHRPERALPRSLFRPNAYLSAAVALATTGLISALFVSRSAGIAALTILVFIGVYTIVHKQTAWSVIPMGICRALLVYLGLTAALHDSGFSSGYYFLGWEGSATFREAMILTGACASALFFHIVGLSLSARRESNPSPKHGLNLPLLLFLAAALLPVLPQLSPYPGWGVFLGSLIYLAWIGFCYFKLRASIPRYVSGLLAGIPLVDWILLLPWGLWLFTMDDLFSLLIPPLAFLLALLLQRVAPAT